MLTETPPQHTGASKEQLPSPSCSGILQKRKASPALEESLSEPLSAAKKPKISHQDIAPASPDEVYDPVAYWAKNLRWPRDIWQRGFGMSSKISANKRRSESTHRSDRLQRLAENGVFMKSSALLQKHSREFCDELLDGEEEVQLGDHMPFPEDQFPTVLDRVQFLNEARIQRDITPWVVPSAEQLHFCGEASFDYIGEEIDALWSRCQTLGTTIPKPDYTAGLLPSAFTRAELTKLRNYSVPDKPVFFTPDLCFPFLICEAKSCDVGVAVAERQNIHSGSLAVKAIIELHRTAFGDDSPKTKGLSGQVLAFSVSHDHDTVKLHCHYGILAGQSSDQSSQSWEFYRDLIDIVSLGLRGGRDKRRSYRFVRNVYKSFAPLHLQRIRDATAALQEVAPRTALSFDAENISLEASESPQEPQTTSQHDNDSTFKKPSLPTSVQENVELKQQLEGLRRQNDALLQQMERQRLSNEKQLAEQRQHSEKQLAEQRHNSERQLAEQRHDSERQLAQLQEIITLIKKQ